jgi:hypothetical protein
MVGEGSGVAMGQLGVAVRLAVIVLLVGGCGGAPGASVTPVPPSASPILTPAEALAERVCDELAEANAARAVEIVYLMSDQADAEHISGKDLTAALQTRCPEMRRLLQEAGGHGAGEVPDLTGEVHLMSDVVEGTASAYMCTTSETMIDVYAEMEVDEGRLVSVTYSRRPPGSATPGTLEHTFQLRISDDPLVAGAAYALSVPLDDGHLVTEHVGDHGSLRFSDIPATESVEGMPEAVSGTFEWNCAP